MTEEISRGRFMKLGGALGVGVAGASVLASCGGGNGDGGASGGEPAGGETSGGAASAEAIAQASELEPGSATTFRNDGEPAVLVHLENGDFAAYSAVCTHQGCTVAYNAGEGTLDCPCHGSVFNPANDAQPVGGPAQRPLPEIPVEVRDGAVVRA